MASKNASALVHPLLQHLAAHEGTLWSRRTLHAGEVVFREGEPGDAVYLALSGKMRISGNLDLDAQRHMSPGVCDLGAGEVFGELAVFDHEPRSATATVLCESELAVIEGAALMAFLDAHPELGYPIFKEIIGLLVKRLRRAN